MKLNLTKPVNIRLEPGIYKKVHQMATSRGMKVSQFVRHLIHTAVERNKTHVEK